MAVEKLRTDLIYTRLSPHTELSMNQMKKREPDAVLQSSVWHDGKLALVKSVSKDSKVINILKTGKLCS